MPEQFYDRDFPDLRRLGYERTSEPHWHNCIAYAAGDFERKWWPDDFPPNSGCYWPLPITDRSSTLDGFVEAFQTLGFERCNDGTWEPEFEKVAFYAISTEVQHAAKQQPDGSWRSKLNEGEDIRHTLLGLEGPCYGKVVAFVRRRVPGSRAIPLRTRIATWLMSQLGR